jgi:pimeloyl-ACP methyl ester carboxylesterase
MNRQVCATYAAPDRRTALSDVAAPTLVLHGSEDPLIGPEAGREVADAIAAARFHVIEGLGHGVLQPAWHELAELIGEHAERGRTTSTRVFGARTTTRWTEPWHDIGK